MIATTLRRGWLLGWLLLGTLAGADTPATPTSMPKPAEAGPKPTKYLTAPEEQALVDQVPPYPATDDADLAGVEQAAKTRTPQQEAEAKLDAKFGLELYQPVYGATVTKEHNPKFYELLENVGHACGAVDGTAKLKFKRLRPFLGHPDKVKALFPVDGFAYPSGHATAAYAFAVVLGAIMPEKQQAFLDRAKLIAESRVNAGVHYPSDIQQGEALGRATAAKLLSEPAFQSDLAAVKAELAK